MSQHQIPDGSGTRNHNLHVFNHLPALPTSYTSSYSSRHAVAVPENNPPTQDTQHASPENAPYLSTPTSTLPAKTNLNEERTTTETLDLLERTTAANTLLDIYQECVTIPQNINNMRRQQAAHTLISLANDHCSECCDCKGDDATSDDEETTTDDELTDDEGEMTSTLTPTSHGQKNCLTTISEGDARWTLLGFIAASNPPDTPNNDDEEEIKDCCSRCRLLKRKARDRWPCIGGETRVKSPESETLASVERVQRGDGEGAERGRKRVRFDDEGDDERGKGDTDDDDDGDGDDDDANLVNGVNATPPPSNERSKTTGNKSKSKSSPRKRSTAPRAPAPKKRKGNPPPPSILQIATDGTREEAEMRDTANAETETTAKVVEKGKEKEGARGKAKVVAKEKVEKVGKPVPEPTRRQPRRGKAKVVTD